MAPGGGRRDPLRPVGLLLLLLLGGAAVGLRTEEKEEVLTQAAFVLRGAEAGEREEARGEFLFALGEEDEIFHVDLARKETVWRRPEFGRFASFQAEGALGNVAVLRSNLEVLIRRSNHTPAQNVPPSVRVYPERPAVPGEPNTLVCRASGFSPPVATLAWRRNGQAVPAERVAETDYYPSRDHSFRKFSYLPFVPASEEEEEEEDVYVCRVEHPGLDRALEREWNAHLPEPLPETAESVACALGLAVGLAGIVAGTALALKSRRPRGPPGGHHHGGGAL